MTENTTSAGYVSDYDDGYDVSWTTPMEDPKLTYPGNFENSKQPSHYACQNSKATVGETLQLRTFFFKKSQNSVMLRCLLSGSF